MNEWAVVFGACALVSSAPSGPATDFRVTGPVPFHDTDTDQLVGFVMISDGIPAETLAADDDIVGPYFLWRLLIDKHHQGRGYGRRMIERNLATLRRLGSPGAHLGLSTLNMRAYGFYKHLGFVELTRVGTPTDGGIYMGIKLK